MTAAPEGGRVRAALLAAAVLGAYLLAVHHHAFLGDDAYISFRYAAHLAAGDGPVYNPGERVEGYTNPSWVALMALVLAAGGSPERASMWVGTASGAGVLLLLARVGPRPWTQPLAWLAPACLAVNRSFAAWSTGGLETTFFTLWVVAAFVAWTQERAHGRPGASAVWLVLAALTRPEGLLLGVLAWLSWLPAWVRGRAGRTRGVAWTAAWLLPLAVHLAWRLHYYGHPLPNTFYAKVSGAWWSQGWVWLRWFADHHAAVLLLPLVGAAVALRPGLRTGGALVVLAAWVAELLYVGGDRFEFRLMVPALPFLFLLAADGVVAAIDRLGRRAGVLALVPLGCAMLPTVVTPTAEAPRGIVHVEGIAAYARQRAEEGRHLRRLVEEGRLAPDTVIAVSGAGALPYEARLPTVDTLGLTDARTAHQRLTSRTQPGHEKEASAAYLAERGVVLHDRANHLVFEAPAPCPAPDSGLRCAVGGGVVLQFATTVDEATLRAALPGLELR
ncbi:MAG: hypothetical protein H6732_14640 [Alphaproteobacteria bacterium]|nr:hypothetical protein [Alphaproteobacteria bacterium]